MSLDEPKTWDVFISYASEDLEAIAEPLALLLNKVGVTVWFDRTSLKLGDSLREKIDEGLARCRFGAVILSEAFFAKHYPNRELNGLAQREVNGTPVILPVWHGVSADRVREFSPPLADRLAVNTDAGVEHVVRRMLEVVRPEIIERLVRAADAVQPLPELTDGRSLVSIISGAHAYLPHYDSFDSEEESELIADFLQNCQDWGDILEDMEIGERIRTEVSLTTAIADLNTAGWRVYGARQKRRIKIAEEFTTWQVAAVAVLRGVPRHVALQGNNFLVEKEAHSEAPPAP